MKYILILCVIAIMLGFAIMEGSRTSKSELAIQQFLEGEAESMEPGEIDPTKCKTTLYDTGRQPLYATVDCGSYTFNLIVDSAYNVHSDTTDYSVRLEASKNKF